MTARPPSTDLPRWATGGGALITPPTTMKMDSGWAESSPGVGEKPALQYANFLQRKTYDFLKWLNDQAMTIDEAQAITGTKDFKAPVALEGVVTLLNNIYLANATVSTEAGYLHLLSDGLKTKRDGSELAAVENSTAITGAAKVGILLGVDAVGRRQRLYLSPAGIELTLNARWDHDAALWYYDDHADHGNGVLQATRMRIGVGTNIGAESASAATMTSFYSGADGWTELAFNARCVLLENSRLVQGAVLGCATASGAEFGKAILEPVTALAITSGSWSEVIDFDNQRPLGCYKTGFGEVCLEGVILGNVGATVLTLPVGYRPSDNLELSTSFRDVTTPANSTSGLIRITSAGLLAVGLSPAVGDTFRVPLNGLRFRAS
jgi:hypothetical protein